VTPDLDGRRWDAVSSRCGTGCVLLGKGEEMSVVRWMFGAGALAAEWALSGAPAWAQATLAAVKKRGELSCGVNISLPAFSYLDDRKERVGFEAD
jgi:hypothetical protein